MWYRNIDDLTDEQLIENIKEHAKIKPPKNEYGEPTILSIDDTFNFISMCLELESKWLTTTLMRKWIKEACTFFK